MVDILEIINLHVSIGDKEILKGLNLKIKSNEIHALMGPNGSGKTSLSYAVMGHPKYKITKGDILFNEISIIKLSTTERARLGLFLAFQYPSEVSGVSIAQFLKQSYSSVKKSEISFNEFSNILKEKMNIVGVDSSFTNRYLNEGFSGGEKKRNEILQMSVIQPKISILDEPDSGTDVDALKIISDGINQVAKRNNTGILLITHYNRILNYVKPNFVHVISDGKIVISGDFSIAQDIESNGYEKFIGVKNGN